jgi:hypothetical protein
MDECFNTSLLRKRTPIAKPDAEKIASISPKLIIDDNEDADIAIIVSMLLETTPILAPLATAILNPISAIMIPIT